MVGGKAPFRSTPAFGLRSAPLRPAANQKKNFFQQKKNLFLEQRSKLGPLLFFFPNFKEPNSILRTLESSFDESCSEYKPQKPIGQQKLKLKNIEFVFFINIHIAGVDTSKIPQSKKQLEYN